MLHISISKASHFFLTRPNTGHELDEKKVRQTEKLTTEKLTNGLSKMNLTVIRLALASLVGRYWIILWFFLPYIFRFLLGI